MNATSWAEVQWDLIVSYLTGYSFKNETEDYFGWIQQLDTYLLHVDNFLAVL